MVTAHMNNIELHKPSCLLIHTHWSPFLQMPMGKQDNRATMQGQMGLTGGRESAHCQARLAVVLTQVTLSQPFCSSPATLVCTALLSLAARLRSIEEIAPSRLDVSSPHDNDGSERQAAERSLKLCRPPADKVWCNSPTGVSATQITGELCSKPPNPGSFISSIAKKTSQIAYYLLHATLVPIR
jgi:hypothetical protein